MWQAKQADSRSCARSPGMLQPTNVCVMCLHLHLLNSILQLGRGHYRHLGILVERCTFPPWLNS